MRTAECTPGRGVVYRPHPTAPAEDGEVVRVSEHGLVFVLYRGDLTPKATPAWMLTPVDGRETVVSTEGTMSRDAERREAQSAMLDEALRHGNSVEHATDLWVERDRALARVRELEDALSHLARPGNYPENVRAYAHRALKEAMTR